MPADEGETLAASLGGAFSMFLLLLLLLLLLLCMCFYLFVCFCFIQQPVKHFLKIYYPSGDKCFEKVLTELGSQLITDLSHLNHFTLFLFVLL